VWRPPIGQSGTLISRFSTCFPVLCFFTLNQGSQVIDLDGKRQDNSQEFTMIIIQDNSQELLGHIWKYFIYLGSDPVLKSTFKPTIIFAYENEQLRQNLKVIFFSKNFSWFSKLQIAVRTSAPSVFLKRKTCRYQSTWNLTMVPYNTIRCKHLWHKLANLYHLSSKFLQNDQNLIALQSITQQILFVIIFWW
jgi:hypothetical protein